MSRSLPLTYSHLFASFFHQDLLSPDASLVSLALATLPSLLNAQLAQDLTHDISSLLTHSKPTVRKRAVLSLYRVFEKYPEALIDNVERLRERLGDDDQGPFAACRAAQRACSTDEPDHLSLLPLPSHQALSLRLSTS